MWVVLIDYGCFYTFETSGPFVYGVDASVVLGLGPTSEPLKETVVGRVVSIV